MEGAGDQTEGDDSIIRGIEMIRTLPTSNWSSSRGYGLGWGEMEGYGTDSK